MIETSPLYRDDVVGGGLVDVHWRTNLTDVINLPKTTTQFTPMLAPMNFGVEPTYGSLLSNTSDVDGLEGIVSPNGKTINKFYFYKVSFFNFIQTTTTDIARN